MVNSSPLKRARVSSSFRMIICSLFEISFKTLSPTSCPSESLISLNLSRSIKKSANPIFSFLDFSIHLASLFVKKVRFGNPVKASWCAWWCKISFCSSSASSACLRRVLSLLIPTIPMGFPNSSRSIESEKEIGINSPDFVTSSRSPLCTPFCISEEIYSFKDSRSSSL